VTLKHLLNARTLKHLLTVLLKISKNLVRYKISLSLSKNNVVGLLNKAERLNADDNKF